MLGTSLLWPMRLLWWFHRSTNGSVSRSRCNNSAKLPSSSEKKAQERGGLSKRLLGRLAFNELSRLSILTAPSPAGPRVYFSVFSEKSVTAVKVRPQPQRKKND